MAVFEQFFFLPSVLVTLKKIIIRGGIGSTWGRNFYMGTQNGSKYEMMARNFDSHLRIKVLAL